MMGWVATAARFLTTRVVLYGALVGAVVLGGTHWWAYQQGKGAVQARMNALIVEHQQRALEAEQRLAEAQREREQRQRKAVREIRDAKDPTGCADERVPDAIRERL